MTVRIYPNPAHDQFRFDCNSETPAMIRFYDMRGKLVANKTAYCGSTVDVSDLSKGLYLLQIETGSHSVRTKISIQ
jgi:hypothetical protein